MGYQGYSNWETFNVLTVLINEESSADALRSFAAPFRAGRDAGHTASEHWTPEQIALFELGYALKDTFERIADDALAALREHPTWDGGMADEFVRLALPSLAYASVANDVNWVEIADSLLSD